MDPKNKAARARLQHALQLVESAQHILEAAAAELSPIRGAHASWGRVCKAAGRTRQLWDDLNAVRESKRVERLSLDREPRPDELEDYRGEAARWSRG